MRTTKPQLFNLYWSPVGRKIATVSASTAQSATRKAPQPYPQFLGEIYAKPAFTQGALYRCTTNTAAEYVTIGQTYRCTSLGRDRIGMHRPADGSGTYVSVLYILQGRVAFEDV